MNFLDSLKAFFAYAKHHPGDCLLHGFKRRRLLREIEGLLQRIRSCPAVGCDEAYDIQCELLNSLGDGYSGLKSWLYVARTSSLADVVEDVKNKLDRIEYLRIKNIRSPRS